jgi:hypothetical protein
MVLVQFPFSYFPEHESNSGGNLLMKNFKILIMFVLIMIVWATANSLLAWERPVLIAGNDGKVYERPGIYINSTGEVYIIFQVRTTSMSSFIPLYKYDGKAVTLLKNVSEASPDVQSVYFPNVAVSDNGEIHTVWAEYTKGGQGRQYIKYRFFDGTAWQPAELLTIVEESDFCEDIRIACDSKKNAFVTLYDSTNGRCHFITKYYGQTATDSFPLSGRSKHTDIAADDNFIYMVWQHMLSPDYGILYQKKENKVNGAWLPAINLNTYYTQRPNIALDKDNKPHVTYWKDYGLDRELFYRQGGEENLSKTNLSTRLSGAAPKSFHYADFSIRADSMFATWQLGNDRGGTYIYYNWYKNGAWSGPAALPGVAFPALTVSALSPDGSNAIIVYPSNDTAIWLISNTEVVAGNPPTPVISSDKTELFWGGTDTIKFDAAGSTPAEGAVITKYEWDFGGTKKEGAQATYTYEDIKQYGSIKVTLTVTDDKRSHASLEKPILVRALYTPTIASLREVHVRTAVFDRLGMEIKWQPNPLNAAFPISGYQIFSRDNTSASKFVKIGVAKPGVLYFIDANRLLGRDYSYGVAAVDDQGRISPLDHFADSAATLSPEKTAALREVK